MQGTRDGHIVTCIGEQALWSWRALLEGGHKIFCYIGGGVIKFFFRVGLEGGRQIFFIADFGVLGQKLVPAPAGEIFFSSRNFFFLKKKRVVNVRKSTLLHLLLNSSFWANVIELVIETLMGRGGQKPFLFFRVGLEGVTNFFYWAWLVEG